VAATTIDETDGMHLAPGLASRIITLVAVAIPPLGLLLVAGVFWGVAVTAVDLGLLLFLYVVPGLGITIGFHRYFTHKSFETSNPMRAVLAILGAMTTQGPVSQWVSDHRKHHAYSDVEGDPHSPHVGFGAGVLGAMRGLWHSHVGWLFSTKGLVVRTRFGRDLTADRLLRVIDRMYFVWVALGFAIPYAIGYSIDGVSGGVQAMVWGGLVRIALFQHVTWSVNSICHMFGKRPFETDDESRNNWAVAFVSLGEGWHHSHHAFPTSARHGLEGRQFDPSYALIKLFARLGWAWDVKEPKPQQLEAKRVDRAPAPAADPEPATQERELVGAGDRS
jgi:stearoyl-CoA desaturase (Delta-9 desaturase)